ncbi:hypothetical protein AMAG_18635 [Allomyces macrogynus ATCC 38327]|uniref:YTH domain-containing protein n=1 Tax=Allomyces macrogynus (strain ATCC 38327) TaxID=578462 RepID=A0A0L0SGJ1_ALLM3|nr:hypothetical protein AMAG_18635 [Allomyces macrogynus ATCC 38327]|eukprot:KNE61470.1 hypothetical protein AMAG_18635 [Allomyces macrogynus ATCC 38327]
MLSASTPPEPAHAAGSHDPAATTQVVTLPAQVHGHDHAVATSDLTSTSAGNRDQSGSPHSSSHAGSAGDTDPAQLMAAMTLRDPTNGADMTTSTTTLKTTSGGVVPTNTMAPQVATEEPRQHRSIWVGNISDKATRDDLVQFFSPFPGYVNLYYMKNTRSAFVNLTTDEAVEEAALHFHGQMFRGSRLICRSRLQKIPVQTVQPATIYPDPMMSPVPPIMFAHPPQWLFFAPPTYPFVPHPAASDPGTATGTRPSTASSGTPATPPNPGYMAAPPGAYYGYPPPTGPPPPAIGMGIMMPPPGPGAPSNAAASQGTMSVPSSPIPMPSSPFPYGASPVMVPAGDPRYAGAPGPRATPPSPMPGAALAPVNRYFIMKSLSLDDLELSLRHRLWSPQLHLEGTLDQAFKMSDNVYLIFSVNKSGEFFGFARMMSPISQRQGPPLRWSIQEGARKNALGGVFALEWVVLQRLPFSHVRHLQNPWNAGKEVKVSRDGTELEPRIGYSLILEFYRFHEAQVALMMQGNPAQYPLPKRFTPYLQFPYPGGARPRGYLDVAKVPAAH